MEAACPQSDSPHLTTAIHTFFIKENKSSSQAELQKKKLFLFTCCRHSHDFPIDEVKGKSVSEKKNEVAQSCPILWDPVDCSPPGFSAHEILQARILEWVAISFSRGSSQPRDQTQVSQALQADALTSEPPGKPSR